MLKINPSIADNIYTVESLKLNFNLLLGILE